MAIRTEFWFPKHLFKDYEENNLNFLVFNQQVEEPTTIRLDTFYLFLKIQIKKLLEKRKITIFHRIDDEKEKLLEFDFRTIPFWKAFVLDGFLRYIYPFKKRLVEEIKPIIEKMDEEEKIFVLDKLYESIPLLSFEKGKRTMTVFLHRATLGFLKIEDILLSIPFSSAFRYILICFALENNIATKLKSLLERKKIEFENFIFSTPELIKTFKEEIKEKIEYYKQIEIDSFILEFIKKNGGSIDLSRPEIVWEVIEKFKTLENFLESVKRLKTLGIMKQVGNTYILVNGGSNV